LLLFRDSSAQLPEFFTLLLSQVLSTCFPDMRYVLLFFGLLAGLSLLSQNVEKSYQHHDILIGYGAFPIDQFLSVESNMLNSSLPDKRYVRDHYSGSGVITLTYRRISRTGLLMWGIQQVTTKVVPAFIMWGNLLASWTGISLPLPLSWNIGM